MYWYFVSYLQDSCRFSLVRSRGYNLMNSRRPSRSRFIRIHWVWRYAGFLCGFWVLRRKPRPFVFPSSVTLSWPCPVPTRTCEPSVQRDLLPSNELAESCDLPGSPVACLSVYSCCGVLNVIVMVPSRFCERSVTCALHFPLNIWFVKCHYCTHIRWPEWASLVVCCVAPFRFCLASSTLFSSTKRILSPCHPRLNASGFRLLCYSIHQGTCRMLKRIGLFRQTDRGYNHTAVR